MGCWLRPPTCRRPPAGAAASGIGPPYILVGHSAGGYIVRLFCAAHPEQVAGVVLVDATTRNKAATSHGPGPRCSGASCGGG
ncbi:alpha/beta fold hydrolase [Nonomuraea roseola]|uniref:Alpha/beta fold hydrolase n=1 Tax=Nonomuraea roseola TaxID=46179 RepID=A0ABV5Q4L2_9ACTN